MAPVELQMESEDEPAASAVDLTALERIRRGRLPVMEMVADRYLREFRNWLLRELRTTGSAGQSSVGTMRFHQFVSQLPTPCVLATFRFPPLSGTGVIAFHPEFAERVLECALGAPGRAKKSSKTPPAFVRRQLSGVETALIKKTARSLLALLQVAGGADLRCEPELLEVESNPLALHFAHPSDQMCCLSFSTEGEANSADLVVVLPLASLGAAGQRNALHQADTGALSAAERAQRKDIIAQALAQVPVELRVILGQTRLSCGAVLALKVGDTLTLDRSPENGAEIWVEGSPRMSGTPGTKNGQHAVTVRGPLAK